MTAGAWRRARLPRVGVLVAVVLVALPACGEREKRKEEVQEYIARTRREANEFIYIEERRLPDLDVFAVLGGGDPSQVTPTEPPAVRVAGVVEDDFRFKAKVTVDGVDAYEQIVSDDALAVRLLEPAYLPDLLRDDDAAFDLSTELEGIDVLAALRSRRWVVDPTAAPPAAASLVRPLGEDPVYDALTALDYVDRAVTEAFNVNEWSSDDLTPAYPSSEDVFPAPEEGSGVRRFDVVRPFLPPPANLGGDVAGDTGVPATRNFRKMAIYVKDGRVIRVIERVEVIGKFVDDFTDHLKTQIEEAEAPQEARDAFDQILTSVPPEELGDPLLFYLNVFLQLTGNAPVIVRTMSLELGDLGQDIRVALPDTDVVTGTLEALAISAAAVQGEVAERGAVSGEQSDGRGGGGGEVPVLPPSEGGG